MTGSMVHAEQDIVRALLCEGPDPEYADRLMTFGQFVGDWDFDWTGFDRDGRVERARGEWLFAWALNGRAVVDVWICPSRQERRNGDVRAGEWGVTVRAYDPAIDAWRVSWSGPAHGNLRTFVAARKDDGIVMDGRDDEGRRVNWVFSEVTGDSFHWRSFLWTDEARPPELREEMFVRRRVTSPSGQVGDAS